MLKFNDICVSKSSPKTDLETNFLNLENRSFDRVAIKNSQQFFRVFQGIFQGIFQIFQGCFHQPYCNFISSNI